MKHIICYSGGVSSALVGAMVIKKFGLKKVVFLNHKVGAEPKDVDRFKEEFARYHRVDITYANADTNKYPNLTPYEVSKRDKAFGVKQGLANNVLCTSRLKTEPFMKWLKNNYIDGDVIYYGFDKVEINRIQRRSTILGGQGYKTDYPLALWKNPLDETYLEFIGIKKPMQYKVFKHANCIGCIKGSRLHWLCVYVHQRNTFEKFQELEKFLGNSIIKGIYLCELVPFFDQIVKLGINITEKQHPLTFWSNVKKLLKEKEVGQSSLLVFFSGIKNKETRPCDCLN